MSSVRDQERFSALFVENYDAIFRYLCRRATIEDARDVAAEVFLIAWRRLTEVPANAFPWLIITARNVLANQIRSGRRADSLAHRMEPTIDRNNDSHEDEVLVGLAWRAALTSLSSQDQELLSLIGWDDLAPRDVAKIVGCTLPTLHMRLHRARRRLLQALRDSNAILPHQIANLASSTKGE